MNNYCIYMHKNKINGKIYIGQTCQEVERRWKKGEGYVDSPRFYNAIKKYGWESFEHIILEDNLTLEQANESECKWIALYKSDQENFGYNMTPGGNNYMSRLWQNEDFRARMKKSFSLARKSMTEEEKEKVIERLIIGVKKAWANEEWRANRIENLIGDKNPNSKKVRNLETGLIFNTIKEASEWCGLSSVSGIEQCCKGKRKTSGKHSITKEPLRWEYYLQGGEMKE